MMRHSEMLIQMEGQGACLDEINNVGLFLFMQKQLYI